LFRSGARVTKPIKDTIKCRFILRYIFGATCTKDRTKADHFLDFYAHLLQRPEQKPSFGIAIRGEEEGTGKSLFIEQMKKIVGSDNSFGTADPEDIFGRNNPGMDGCMLLHLEEVEWAMYNRYANKLRNLYTTPTINITDKYEKEFVQNSFTRISISGNAEHIQYKIIVERLTWCFNDWQRSRGERAQLSAKAFGRQFSKIVPEMRPAHDVKHQPDWLGRQLNCFELPSLGKCRDFFVQYQGWKHKTWNNAENFYQTYVDKNLWYRER
jgi:Family of unknown function (DUF5906)